ncbi:MAG: T9SS type A sorting domain-containing protein [Phaeodactylibacter sp.]|nr:T9SS type A sorting domain-containing protein [Phaeodactylibacter sp.]MCB9051823.1 T9SS type A sorting domain-containing protein [Lewinellaceae bacterium]
MCRNLLLKACHRFTWKLQHPSNRLLLILPFALLLQVASAQFTVNLTVTEPNCYGLPTGSIAASVAGGTMPFTYVWSTGATGSTLSNISAGSYSVTVTDGTGTSVSQSTTVNQPTVVTVSLAANTCQIPFLITATGSGGNPPYNYTWSTGATGPVISTPNPGTYCVTMTDQNLCGAVNCITVDINPLDVSVTTNGLTCPDSDDGEVQAVVTGGTPPYTYAWSNGATTATQTGLATGTYTVTVTDVTGCSDSASGTVSAPPPLMSDVTGAGPDCAGGTDGSATASATGGTPPYSYLWSNGATTAGITNLGAGTYSVTITDVQGCDIVDMITLTPTSTLQAMATATPESCPDTNDGTATATAVNGVPPYIYLWSNGAVTQTITGLTPGTYSVTIIDGLGCTASASVEVTAAPPLEISLNGTDVTTCDAADGTATVTIVQGLAPLTIAWSTGASTATVSGLTGGTYGVTVTDANGCTETGTVVVTQPPNVSVTVIATPTVCPGESTGMATAVVSGGTMPFSFAWNTGDTGPVINNLPAGTYTVVVVDANGCQAMGSATIGESPQLQATVDGTEIVCGMGATGEATVTASGGTPPYSYEWSTGESTESVEGLLEGTYSVVITDANGCIAMAEVNIDVVDDFELVIVGRNVLCHGEATGSILVTATGGTPPYTYNWSTGATTNEITNLTAGAYSVTVTEAGGCVAEETITINEPPALNLSVSGTNLTCPDDNNGTATASASGGTPPYSYSWSNGGSTASISGLAAGIYTVTATDANLCEATGSVTLTAPPQLQGTVNSFDVLCAGGSDGFAVANITGGTLPYSYAWSTGGSGSFVEMLSAGSYSVSVSDANGCDLVLNFTVDEPSPIMASLDVTNIFCDDNAGAITASASGGTPPYTFEWSNGGSGATLTGLAAGTYTVTITDQNECEEVLSGTVEQFPGLMLTPVATAPQCAGEMNGSAAVVVTGGTPPFTYLWSNGSTDTELIGIPAGVYSVTVTDAAGCTGETIVSIAEPQELIAQVTPANIVHVDCFGNSTGSATITASGGALPYLYLWSNGQTGATATNLSAGTYTATITDANGCEVMITVVINEPPALVVVVDSGEAGSCDNASDGTATVTASGGTPPYTYLWSNGATTPIVSNLAPGTYSVTVTDANNCPETGIVVIDAFESPECVVVILHPVTEGNTDGELRVTVTGGTGPYTYLWNNGQTTATINNLAAGFYSVTVTDANGCETDCNASLSSPCENITNPGLIGPNQFLCGPGNDPGVIMNIQTPSGGVGPIEYLWMMSTQPGPFNVQTWTAIPNSNFPSYDPPVLYETTYYARCVRREDCTIYLESNIVTIEVGSVANAEINGPSYLCVGDPATFTAGPTSPNAVITWQVSGPATPSSGTGSQITVTASAFGLVYVTLQVVDNGCTAHITERYTATTSPLYCGGQGRSLPINVEVRNQDEGQVIVSWMMEGLLAEDHEFTVEHSDDGVHFEALGDMNTPQAFLGSMNYYEFEHRSPKRGRNFYRIQINSPYGAAFFSEIGEAILYNDSEVALLYPNPTMDQVVLELFENFGQEVQVEVFNANGARTLSRTISEETQRAEFDLSNYPSGVYFFNLRYSKSGVKVLKVLKH